MKIFSSVIGILIKMITIEFYPVNATVIMCLGGSCGSIILQQFFLEVNIPSIHLIDVF